MKFEVHEAISRIYLRTVLFFFPLTCHLTPEYIIAYIFIILFKNKIKLHLRHFRLRRCVLRHLLFEDCLALKNGSDRLPRNFGNQLPNYAT